VFPVFDDFAFFPDLTVVEHLELLAGLHGLPDRAAAAAEALDRFGIGAVAGQFPVTLSSGQSRRVALACAAVRPWSVLLLDEPEQRLDEDGRDRLLRFLEERLGQGKAVVLATHDRPLVEALGARVIAMAA
jgi:ABC-type multidrug transport system ATPase subunit